MIPISAIEKLKSRYPDIHPLVFKRSLENAKDLSDLFEILESIPEYPIVWDSSTHKWVNPENVVFTSKIKELYD